MSRLSLQSLSERQQVVAIILMAGVVMVGLWFFLLMPQNRTRRGLERQIADMQRQLAANNYLRDESVLQNDYSRRAINNQVLQREWSNTVARMTTFPQHQDLLNSEVGHIDYKVALFEVRQRLLRKSRQRNVRIRHDGFGMEEEVRSDEDARKLMLQLRAMEKLVDFMFDCEISLLRNIDPLPPIRHVAGPKKTAYIEEYPVALEFQGGLDNVYTMLETVRYPQYAFALRRIQIGNAVGEPDTVQVNAVISALVFLKDPADVIEEIPRKPVKRLTPLGH